MRFCPLEKEGIPSSIIFNKSPLIPQSVSFPVLLEIATFCRAFLQIHIIIHQKKNFVNRFCDFSVVFPAKIPGRCSKGADLQKILCTSAEIPPANKRDSRTVQQIPSKTAKTSPMRTRTKSSETNLRSAWAGAHGGSSGKAGGGWGGREPHPKGGSLPPQGLPLTPSQRTDTPQRARRACPDRRSCR